jgi:hypothetical protein
LVTIRKKLAKDRGRCYKGTRHLIKKEIYDEI